MILSAVLCLALLPHGGRFQPPLGSPPLSSSSAPAVPLPPVDSDTDGEGEDLGDQDQGEGSGDSQGDGDIEPNQPTPRAPGALPSLPGMGPVAYFEGDSWEWWFDFNEEDLIDVSERMASRATRPGDRPYEAVSEEDRQELLFPVLAHWLDSRDRDLRAAAAMSLGRLGLPSAVPLLVEATRDTDLFVRAQAVISLGASGRPAALEPLSALAADRHQSDEMRVFALAAMALVDGDESRGLLAHWLVPQRLARENNVFRAGAIFAAGVQASPGLLEPLLTLADSHLCRKEPTMEALMAGALGRLPTERALPALLIYARRQDNRVRRSAAAGLQGNGPRLSPAQARWIWEQIHHEGDWSIRLSLIKALAGCPLPWVGEHLERLLSTSRTGALPHVALALGLDGSADHVQPLIELLSHRHDASLRGAIAVALGLAGDPRATAPLTTLLDETPGPQLQSALCLALGLIDDEQPGQVDTLLELAENSHDIEVVRHAIMGLGLLGAREALDDLSRSLGSVHGSVDLAARLHALGLSGDRRQIAPLLKLVRDDQQPRFVIRYALGALGDLGDPRPIGPAGRFSRHADLDLDIELLFELYRML